MKVVFRVDSSVQIGTGHVMRCLTLAKFLRKQGAECVFVCREHKGGLNSRIQSEGFIVKTFSSNINVKDEVDVSSLAHASWLGTSWSIDAQQTIDSLGEEIYDWLVVDHYALDKRWEIQLRRSAKRILIIDDLADREHDCDLLLDQNLVADYESRYSELIPSACSRLLGPKYALLQPEYSELHSRVAPRKEKIQRILVYFGGSDLHNLTGLTISAFIGLNREDLDLDVVINPKSPYVKEIKRVIAKRTNITLYGMVPSLAKLTMLADLAIGAGGATSWERCCLGVPALIITVAENQKPIAMELDRKRYARWLGHYDTISKEVLLDAIQTEIKKNTLSSFSEHAYKIVDGKGASRLSQLMNDLALS